ncbi:energy-coupling factor ABC transporter permease [Dechloromonas sp. ZY10]|uniref:energy-coupling factor ABC transporter permease n=1 Tax=Dechloromonas aquae TaxID=2664436 RepID=UPI003526F65D
MNLPDTLLDPAWYWTAFAVWAALLVYCLWRAPWRRLQDSELLNVWLGMIVLLTLIWSLQAGVKPGLALHLLGATIFTLCFGPALAFAGLSLVALGVALNSDNGWLAYPLNALLLAGGGVVLSQALYRLFVALLPRHFFVFIFINGFLGSALTVVGIGLLANLLLGISGAYAWDYLMEEYLPYFVLLAFAEAWLSGMVMTLFVVYRPHWVVTFDDRQYLAGK